MTSVCTTMLEVGDPLESTPTDREDTVVVSPPEGTALAATVDFTVRTPSLKVTLAGCAGVAVLVGEDGTVREVVAVIGFVEGVGADMVEVCPSLLPLFVAVESVEMDGLTGWTDVDV